MSVSRRTGLASVHATKAEVCQDLVAGFGTWMSTSRRSTRLGCDCRWFSALVSRFEQLTRSVPSGAIVLDVGCRTGGVAYRYAIARPDVRVIGLDRSPRMLRELRLTAQGVPRTVELPGSKVSASRPAYCRRANGLLGDFHRAGTVMKLSGLSNSSGTSLARVASQYLGASSR